MEEFKVREFLPKRYGSLVKKKIKEVKNVVVPSTTIHNYVSQNRENWEHWDCIIMVCLDEKRRKAALAKKAKGLAGKKVRKRMNLGLVSKI